MTENEKGSMSVKSFDFWFWLFVLATVITVAFYGRLSIASAHMLCMALFMRQLSFVWTEETERKAIQRQLKELNERMDKIDPYSKDK